VLHLPGDVMRIRRARRATRRDRDSGATERFAVAEQLLIDVLPELAGDRILCTTLGHAGLAFAAATRNTTSQVVCQFFDLHFANEARRSLTRLPPNLELRCAADLPGCGPLVPQAAGDSPRSAPANDRPPEVVPGDFDVVALPIHTAGSAEFVRELLQQGHQALRIGGRIAAAVKNPRDTWLHDELRRRFSRVTRRPTSAGMLYFATKTEPLKKLKVFACEFAFRDREHLIRLVSRPGVFSHRKLDGGARALIKSMTVAPAARVLDIGCGAGAVGIAAALRATDVEVVAIDSHTRAVACAARGAALNGITRLRTILTDDGDTGEPGSFDIALGNPPYFGDHGISELFLQSARRALRPGGTVQVVTKSPAWYEARLPSLFDNVETTAVGHFTVVSGRNR
jgi:16S rRNA (guanine1207-N2)-methyltransferase